MEVANDDDFVAPREVAAVMAEDVPVPATEPVVSIETAEAGHAAPAAAEAAPAAEEKPVEQPAEAAPVQPAAEPEPEPVAVVLTPPDPDRPTRAGWWSKAKSVLSGS